MRYSHLFALLLSLGLGAPTARAAPEPLPSCPGPPVERLVAAALRRAQPEAEQDRSWRRRLAWSGLLPRLSARLGQASSSGELVAFRPDSPDRLDLNNYLALRWEVRATWDLGRLIFDSRELRVSARSAALGAERQRLVENVVQLYFRRCGLLLMKRNAALPEAEALERELQLRQLTALLDALSGGLLSKLGRP